MLDQLTAMPVRSEDGRAWLGDDLFVDPHQIMASRLPTIAEISAVLDDFGLVYDASDDDDTGWMAVALAPHDRWFSDVWRGPDHLGFWLGPLSGPIEIVRALAVTCGPFVCVIRSGGGPALIGPDTSTEEALVALQKNAGKGWPRSHTPERSRQEVFCDREDAPRWFTPRTPWGRPSG